MGTCRIKCNGMPIWSTYLGSLYKRARARVRLRLRLRTRTWAQIRTWCSLVIVVVTMIATTWLMIDG